MSHPPIPKCKWFGLTLGGTWALNYLDADGKLEDFINLEPVAECGYIPDASVRYFAACVAECEWRKRSTRWSALAVHVIDRMLAPAWGTTGHRRSILRPRRDRYWERAQECEDVAYQWRAWGEAK